MVVGTIGVRNRRQILFFSAVLATRASAASGIPTADVAARSSPENERSHHDDARCSLLSVLSKIRDSICQIMLLSLSRKTVFATVYLRSD